MEKFPYHTPESAPQAALPVLEAAQQTYGMLPNLFRKMAESPVLAHGYWELGKIFANSSLTATEQQVVLLATSTVNGCTYCVGAHSAIAGMMNIPDETIAAIRDGKTIPDPKLQALRAFTQLVVTERGRVPDSVIQEFKAAGYSRAQVLEVIVGVGLKTLSNYANHIMQTGLDDAFAAHAWQAGGR